MKKKTRKRSHPVVGGRATTFPDLAARLGISVDAARGRYNKLASEGPVGIGALRAIDRARERRAARDVRITHERHTNGRPLAAIANRRGIRLSVQRIQQIAGAVQ